MTAATDRDALLLAIVSDPADDLSRLAYADWCEENGDGDRGEFIRVQVDISGWRTCPGSPHGRRRCPECDRRATLRRREGELKQHLSGDNLPMPGWCVGISSDKGDVFLAPGGRHPMIPVTLRSGFVHAVTCDAIDWLAHGAEVVRAQPVGQVTLSDREPTTTLERTFTLIGNPFDERDFFVNYFVPRQFIAPQQYLVAPTRKEVLRLLSAACIAWARNAAGLPPMLPLPV